MARANGEDGRRHRDVRQLELALHDLELDSAQKANLSRRYLDYLDWLEGAAARAVAAASTR
jgi:hypothetical protein